MTAHFLCPHLVNHTELVVAVDGLLTKVGARLGRDSLEHTTNKPVVLPDGSGSVYTIICTGADGWQAVLDVLVLTKIANVAGNGLDLIGVENGKVLVATFFYME